MDQKRLEVKLFIERSTGNTRAANRAKGNGQKGDSKGKLRGYFGKINGVSGRRESRLIVTQMMATIAKILEADEPGTHTQA